MYKMNHQFINVKQKNDLLIAGSYFFFFFFYYWNLPLRNG